MESDQERSRWWPWWLLIAFLAGNTHAGLRVVRPAGAETDDSVIYSHGIADDPTPDPTRWEPIDGSAGLSDLNPDGDASGDGTPDFGVNVDANRTEVVWSMVGATGESPVWSCWTGTVWTDPVGLATEGAGPRAPRLTFLQDAGTGVAWWGDGNIVHYRERQGDGDVWTADYLLSQPGEVAGRPDLADPGDGARVAFPLDRGSGWEIFVETRIGPPTATPSFAREFIGFSFAAEDPEVRVETQGGKLWITWRHDDDELGWSRFDGAGWTGPRMVPIPDEDIEAARFDAKLEVVRAR